MQFALIALFLSAAPAYSEDLNLSELLSSERTTAFGPDVRIAQIDSCQITFEFEQAKSLGTEYVESSYLVETLNTDASSHYSDDERTSIEIPLHEGSAASSQNRLELAHVDGTTIANEFGYDCDGLTCKNTGRSRALRLTFWGDSHVADGKIAMQHLTTLAASCAAQS